VTSRILSCSRLVLFVVWILLSLTGICAAGPYDAWSDPAVEVVFTGTGLESGHVLNMKVSNKGKETVSFQLPQLTVLEPSSGAYAPMVVESKGGWEIPPGRDFTVKVLGYSLDQSKAGPRRGQSVKYAPVVGNQHSTAQYALKKSLEYERSRGFQATLLPLDKHRTLVIQRLIWTVYGARNPKTPQALVEDLDRRFQSGGETVSAQSVHALAGSIWKDVERVHGTL
jgi:hypothetical protein